jgi:hypothetical protein
MATPLDRPAAAAARAVGAALAGATRALAAVRPAAKPLHPLGRLRTALLERHGCTPPTGVAWLDEAGVDEVVVRISRAVGLPDTLPDIHGLAVRVPVADGTAADLLLASTGSGRVGRFVLTASRAVEGRPMTTLLPYRTPSGPMLLRARSTAPEDFELAVAPPGGEWRPFALLRLGPETQEQHRVSFDPVLNTLPGLEHYDWVRRLREPAYRVARRTRRPGP